MGLVLSDDGWRLPDWLWERVEPLLPAPPAHPLGCHRPRVPDRAAMDAILLVLRTGMQWNALNATGICSSSSAHRRFQEWEQPDDEPPAQPGPEASPFRSVPFRQGAKLGSEELECGLRLGLLLC